MKWHSFSEVVTDATSKFKKIKASDYQTTGKYKIIDQGKGQIAGYTDDANLVNDQLLPILIFGDHTRALKYEDEPIALGADGAKALLVNSNLAITRYVYYYLRSIQIKEAGYSRHFKFLKEVKIPIPFKNGIPDFDDQKRIAYLLGKVEGLIDQRKQHLRQLDELLRSVFMEMFGDPVRNEKGWPLKTIADLVVEVKYGTSASAQGGQFKYLRMNNITQDGYWNFTNMKYIDVDEKDFEKYCLRKGDLVFNRTNSKELVGKTAVYELNEPIIIAGYLIRVRVNAHNNPWFIWGHLNSKYGKTRLFNLCRNIVGMANINAKELQAIPILQPPLPLQNQFADSVEKILRIKSRYQQSLTDLESLYGALSQQAFKGELDLSRVSLPPDSPSECENKQDEAAAPIKSDIPKGIKIKLESLNVFNENATGLKDIARAARASSLIDSKQFDIVKQAAAQLAAYHSPIEQLKNMSGIASAMEQLESTIKPLNLSQYDSIAKTAELARSMASSISKSDLSWLDQQHSAALKYANEPFESMHSAMENIESLNYRQAESIVKRAQSALDYSTIVPKIDTSISTKIYRDAQKATFDPLADIRKDWSISKYTQHLDAAARIQNIIPDFTTWQQRLASDSLVNYFDTEEGCERPLFYAENILDILSNTTEPLTFKNLIDQLNELGTVDFVGYETIKTILFDLLAENQITQAFDEKQQILLFSIVKNGSEQ